jgi:hypothetical protein
MEKFTSSGGSYLFLFRLGLDGASVFDIEVEVNGGVTLIASNK